MVQYFIMLLLFSFACSYRCLCLVWIIATALAQMQHFIREVEKNSKKTKKNNNNTKTNNYNLVCLSWATSKIYAFNSLFFLFIPSPMQHDVVVKHTRNGQIYACNRLSVFRFIFIYIEICAKVTVISIK